jgi:hypothetical protein
MDSDDKLTPAESAWCDWLDGKPSVIRTMHEDAQAVSLSAFEAGAQAERKALADAWREVLAGDPDRWLNVRHLWEEHRRIFRTDEGRP